MGLDMYLTGQKYLRENFQEPEKNVTEDGFTLKTKELRLGYWRKHPDLHGFIVQTFADGVDECQKIDLSPDQMRTIVQAVKDKKLPKTGGFFFGESDGSEDEETIKIFEAAIQWAETEETGVWRDVYYQASW